MSLWKIDFTVGTNEDWCDSIDLTTPGDVPEPYPLTPDWQVRQQLRTSAETLATVMDLSLANEGIVLLQTFDEEEALTASVLAWNKPKAVMQTIEPGDYVHDIVFVDPDGGIIRFAEGIVTVVRGITRWQ